MFSVPSIHRQLYDLCSHVFTVRCPMSCHLLLRESFGGNAGNMPDGCPCAGANFYFDNNSGEIADFGNFQDVSEKIRRYPGGIFRVAMDFGRTWGFEIVGTYYKDHSYSLERLAEAPDASGVAMQALQRSVELYNAPGSCKPFRAGHPAGRYSGAASQRVLPFLRRYLRL